eukprot:scaffold834_cov123-Cylindrotheca_fusiformis.AAC.8
MISGFVGLMGISAVTKKLGGYSNTKYHGYLSCAGLTAAFGGMYVIYKNKDMHNKPHFTSTHAWMGIATLTCAFLPAVAGLVFLHPDFGTSKTNKFYRFVHKWCARSAIVAAYITGYWGLSKMTQDPWVLASYAIPLIALEPQYSSSVRYLCPSWYSWCTSRKSVIHEDIAGSVIENLIVCSALPHVRPSLFSFPCDVTVYPSRGLRQDNEYLKSQQCFTFISSVSTCCCLTCCGQIPPIY